MTESQFQKTAASVLKLLGERPAVMDIVLLDHEAMKRMKWRYMRKRTEPNVISFPEPAHFPHPESRKRYLGEIYLNRDILRRQPERSVPLLVHGVLHLLGYDHIEKKDAAIMERMEEKAVSASKKGLRPATSASRKHHAK